MLKQALFTAVAAAVMGTTPLLAGEGSRLSPPADLQPPVAAKSVPAKLRTLRPARVAVAETDEQTIEPGNREPKPAVGQKSLTKAEAVGLVKQTKIVAAPAPAKGAEQSSRRTASTTTNASHSITFRPVEAVVKDEALPLPARIKSPSRSLVDAYRAAKDDAVSETTQSVVIAATPPKSLAGKVLTPQWSQPSEAAESEKIEAAETKAPAKEEALAPIVDAADLPRPSRIRRTSANEQLAPASVSWPTIIPTTPQERSSAAEPEPVPENAPKSAKKSAERKQKREPRQLSSLFSGLTEMLPLSKRKANEEGDDE